MDLFFHITDHRVKMKESENRDEYLDLVRQQKKAVKHEGDDDSNCKWRAWNSPQGKETEGIGNQRENTRKSPRDMCRLAVTQTSSKNSLNWCEKIID